ncbi:unnamed protein product, partial [Ectocarpus sp. 8 AP-2014]
EQRQHQFLLRQCCEVEVLIFFFMCWARGWSPWRRVGGLRSVGVVLESEGVNVFFRFDRQQHQK